MSKHHLWKLIFAVALTVFLFAPGVSATSLVFQSPPPVPPPNDNFANALTISGNSYNSGWIDVSLATTEVGEQTATCGYTTQHTIWYAFTAPSSGQVSVSVYGDYYYYPYDPTIGLNVFQGPVSGFPTLEAYCTTWSPAWGGGSLSFTAQAETIYYLQVATTYAPTDNQLVFSFQFTPPPPPPPNDNFADAAIISGSGYYQSVDVTGATTETGEPTGICSSPRHTMWYAYTPLANGAVNVSTWGSNGDAVLNAYRADGEGLGGLSSSLGCVNNGYFSFNVQANETYYFQAGTIWSAGGNLNFSMSFIPAPANDNFANATLITSLPYDLSTDMTAASSEAGEQMPSCGSTTKTIWYAYTPAESGSLSQRTNTWSYTVVGVYTGSSLGTLQEVACRNRNWYDSNFLTFHVNAGTIYYFQLGTSDTTSIPFYLQSAEPPYPNFDFYPSDPNTFDTVYFNNYSWDPANAGISSVAWDFGDGTTATDPWSPSHRYARDGDYTAKLTVTTPDGRTASTSRTVSVKTHDVAITKFTVPQSASAGQTRQIVVGLNNKRYVEEVQVVLYKSMPGGGWQWIASSQQTVPIRPANRTTDFSFNYTFTKDDAAIGKVTFRAVATIINARDALPNDNEAIASPTKVSR
jgi:hypothetical protein